jgi:catechol 2,3-dioxygenase-like lactoylglutathione lyase family enzyme
MVRGIDNIGICATDLSRSVAFYETLGFSEAYRNDRGVMLAAGTVHLFLFAARRTDAMPVRRELGLFGNPPGIDHISFAVGDVDVLYTRLIKAGVVFEGPPEDQSWGARMVGLKDPDGNNLYLLHRLQKPSRDNVHRDRADQAAQPADPRIPRSATP